MTLFAFTVEKGAETGDTFRARFTASTIDGQKLLRSSLMPTVTISDGATLETADPVTIAELSRLAKLGSGALARGVTVSIVAVPVKPATNYDAVTLAARTEAPPSEGKPIDIAQADPIGPVDDPKLDGDKPADPIAADAGDING